MKITHYNKLVRNNIPNLLPKGMTCKTTVLNSQDYEKALVKKLQEELDEFKESGDVMELADLIEVIYAVLRHQRISLADFNEMRLHKANVKGDFSERLFLISTEE